MENEFEHLKITNKFVYTLHPSENKVSEISQEKNSLKPKLNDLQLVNVLNKIMFYIFLTFIILLNIFCLYVLPVFFRESISINNTRE